LQSNYQIKPIVYESDSIAEVQSLLQTCFPNEKKYTQAFLCWQYLNNPDGKVIGYNAYHDNKLVAHYACQPQQWRINKTPVSAMLSLNTATHPQHQGKGLFTKLANETYRLGKTHGIKFVIGVANQNSYYGFINKLSFQSLGALHAKIGIYTKFNEYNTEFFRAMNIEGFKWRFENPSADYFVFNNFIASATSQSFIHAMLAPMPNQIHSNLKIKSKAPLQLIIGNDNYIKQWKGIGINIPGFARPSPLHLIIKPLDNINFNTSELQFGLADFDAF
jgi:GNAT superfamily N-acetyltransferase